MPEELDEEEDDELELPPEPEVEPLLEAPEELALLELDELAVEELAVPLVDEEELGELPTTLEPQPTAPAAIALNIRVWNRMAPSKSRP